MALEFFTGFEGCGSTADTYTLFNLYSWFSYAATNGYNNGKCININDVIGYIQRNCTPAKTKAFGNHLKGAASFDSNITDADRAFCVFKGPEIMIFNTSSGLKVSRGGTLLATFGTTLTFFGTTVTRHFQAKLFSDASAGTIEIWIDGALFGSATGLNTGGANVSGIRWYSSNTNVAYRDNLYISDVIEGELISQLCKPSSDSAVQFTPSAGIDNYLLVDDPNQDGDTTYVESSTVGHQDLYTYEDVPSGYLVKGVSVVTVAKKDDPGSRTLQVRGKQDATEYDIGSALALNTEYPIALGTGAITTISLAPDGTAWTLAKFNACTWGFKVAS